MGTLNGRVYFTADDSDYMGYWDSATNTVTWRTIYDPVLVATLPLAQGPFSTPAISSAGCWMQLADGRMLQRIDGDRHALTGYSECMAIIWDKDLTVSSVTGWTQPRDYDNYNDNDATYIESRYGYGCVVNGENWLTWQHQAPYGALLSTYSIFDADGNRTDTGFLPLYSSVIEGWGSRQVFHSDGFVYRNTNTDDQFDRCNPDTGVMEATGIVNSAIDPLLYRWHFICFQGFSEAGEFVTSDIYASDTPLGGGADNGKSPGVFKIYDHTQFPWHDVTLNNWEPFDGPPIRYHTPTAPPGVTWAGYAVGGNGQTTFILGNRIYFSVKFPEAIWPGEYPVGPDEFRYGYDDFGNGIGNAGGLYSVDLTTWDLQLEFTWPFHKLSPDGTVASNPSDYWVTTDTYFMGMAYVPGTVGQLYVNLSAEVDSPNWVSVCGTAGSSGPLTKLVPTSGAFQYPEDHPSEDFVAIVSDSSDSTFTTPTWGGKLYYSPADFAGASRIVVKARWEPPTSGSTSLSLELIEDPWPGPPTGGNIFTITPVVTAFSEYTFDTNSLPEILDDPAWNGWVYPAGTGAFYVAPTGSEIAAALSSNTTVMFDIQTESTTGPCILYAAEVWVAYATDTGLGGSVSPSTEVHQDLGMADDIGPGWVLYPPVVTGGGLQWSDNSDDSYAEIKSWDSGPDLHTTVASVDFAPIAVTTGFFRFQLRVKKAASTVSNLQNLHLQIGSGPDYAFDQTLSVSERTTLNGITNPSWFDWPEIIPGEPSEANGWEAIQYLATPMTSGFTVSIWDGTNADATPTTILYVYEMRLILSDLPGPIGHFNYSETATPTWHQIHLGAMNVNISGTSTPAWRTCCSHTL